METSTAAPAAWRRPTHDSFVPAAPIPPARDLPWPKLLLTLRRNSLQAWPARAYRDLLVHRRFMGTDCFLLNDPAAARHVLSDSAAAYVRPVSARRLLRPGTGGGLLIAEGDDWRRQRRMVAPAYTPRHVETLIPRFIAAAEDMLETLDGASQARLGEVLERAAIDAAGRAMFSIPLTTRADRIGGLLRSYFNQAARAQIFDFVARTESSYRWFARERTAFSRNWFAEIEALIAERRKLELAPTSASDLFELLRIARDHATGEPLGDIAIRDQIASMLAAGFDTTARTMFWTVYLLAHVPEAQAAVRAELRNFPPSTLQTLRDLERWPTLRAVLLEAIRLYPPTSVLSRVPLSDDMVLGTPIRRGSLVMVSPWVMHRHEKLWQSPAMFVPGRFADNPQAYLSEPAYLPFGAGPRSCLGAVFAMAEASIILAHLLARFEIAIDGHRPVMPVAIVSTVPDHEPRFWLTRC